MINLTLLMDYTLCHINYTLCNILIIIFSISSKNIKKHKIVTEIYVEDIGNTISFKIKTGYFLELLTAKTMKFLVSTKNKMSKDENGKNVPHLQINEVVFVHCNIANNDYQHDSRVLFTFVPNNSFVQLLNISPKVLCFQKPLIRKFQILKLAY